MGKINKIKVNGTPYEVEDKEAVKTVTLTQAEYDTLQTKDPSIFYVISDGQGGGGGMTSGEVQTMIDSSISGKADSSGVTQEISAATSGKVDTSTFETYSGTVETALSGKQDTLIAGSGITISGNVISAAGGGGGKAVSGGTNISITTGETADTINCTLPISRGSGNNNSLILGTGNGNTASGQYSIAVGGRNNSSSKYCSLVGGNENQVSNEYETAFGNSNVTNYASTTFGNSGNTLFSVGNGSNYNFRHNAFEIRQDGSIYIPDLSNGTNYRDRPMIKLQDALGGGGSSYTAGDGIDITNDVISVTGKVDTTAFTAHTADTVIHVTSTEKAAWNAKSDFSGNYNDLSNKPTIPSKTSDLTNDSNFATTGDVQTATNDMATKTWVGQQGYLTQHQDISGKQDVSGMTAYTTTATTSALNNVVTAHTANTSIHVSAEQIAAWDAKSDFSGSYNDLTNKLSAGTNVTIVDNVISAEGGGGKAIEAGRGISITTGETADTVSFSLPISAGTGAGSLIIGDNGYTSYASVANGLGAVAFPGRPFYGGNRADGESSFAHGTECSASTASHAEGSRTKCTSTYNSHSEGANTEVRGMNSHSEGEYTLAGTYYTTVGCHAEGFRTSAMTNYSHAEGSYTKTTNVTEHASGQYNNSVSASTTFGDSGNTLFSVGNGTANNARHNAFEIRQNGDIYISKDGQDVKLQDQLGGGGITSGEVQDMIDTSISGKQDILSAGTGIDITDNTISVTGGSGGGKAVSGGTNISITTGETADTINCTLPITATSSPFDTISVGKNSGGGRYNTMIGPNTSCDYSSMYNVFLIAQRSNNSSEGSYVKGKENVIIGSMKTGYPSWDIPSFSTSQSVVIGGGQMSTDKNNSLAIGYNANVSGTTKTNINNQLTIDTSNQVYIYNKDNTEMICLQDHLGGGGASYSAGTGIDITNNVISVSGVVETSAITTSVTSSSTDAQVPSAKAVYDIVGNIETLLSQI